MLIVDLNHDISEGGLLVIDKFQVNDTVYGVCPESNHPLSAAQMVAVLRLRHTARKGLNYHHFTRFGSHHRTHPSETLHFTEFSSRHKIHASETLHFTEFSSSHRIHPSETLHFTELSSSHRTHPSESVHFTKFRTDYKSQTL